MPIDAPPAAPRSRPPRLGRRLVVVGVLLVATLGVAGLIVAAAGWPRSPDPVATPAPPVLPAPPPTTSRPPGPTHERYVSLEGSDDGTGTADHPWRTIQHALSSLEAGQTLYVRGGVYSEDVRVSARPGTASRPVLVRAYPGERAVVEGRLWLYDASFWHLDGINVTWDRADASGKHMVAMLGGTSWRFSNAELWGARGYAALLVARSDDAPARSFTVDHNFIHDTYPSNDVNQDHLIYVGSNPGGSGVIEHNVLARSANGRGVKLGPGSLDRPGASDIVIRYNTFYGNLGPSNIQLSGSSSNNQIYGNLLEQPSDGTPNITEWNLTGTNNVIRDNLGWASDRVAEFGPGLIDGGGNLHADPMLTDPEHDDFRPRWPPALRYGTETAPRLVTGPGAR